MSHKCDESRFLVFAADDLGKSASVNKAVFDAYDNGILTAASIMAGGEALKPAVKGIIRRKDFSVGLHVTLCDGNAILSHSAIPGLTGPDGKFSHSAAAVWLKLGNKKVMKQVEAEITAQFDKIEAEGLRPAYVDGHHHLHMHPGLFKAVCRIAAGRGVSFIRLPNEPLSVVARFRARYRRVLPFAEWAVFGMLRNKNRKIAREYGLCCATNVYGLSGTGQMSEDSVICLLEHMSADKEPFVNELFFHPDKATESGLRELKALKSEKVISKLDSLGIKPIGYSVKIRM